MPPKDACLPKRDVDQIRKVTVADVNRVARQYLVDNNSIISTLVPKPSGEPVASRDQSGNDVFKRRDVMATQTATFEEKIAARIHDVTTARAEVDAALVALQKSMDDFRAKYTSAAQK